MMQGVDAGGPSGYVENVSAWSWTLDCRPWSFAFRCMAILY